MDLILLAIGFLFGFFIPGIVLIESFYKVLPIYIKLPLYILLSVLLSTFTAYFVSLIIGYSIPSILLVFSLYLVWGIVLLLKRERLVNPLKYPREHRASIILSVGLFFIFLIALLPAIVTQYQGNYILSSVNWQDTAMHISIIENISQGNFPPEAMYFSGYPLSYYYFIDLHSAILETLFGNYFPQIITFTNPFFIMLFSLSVYALSFYFTKNARASLIAAFIACLTGNLRFLKLFTDISDLPKGTVLIDGVNDLIAKGGYTMEFNGVMGMAPLADYFLQNRPMMLGLPAFVLTVLLIYIGFKEYKGRFLILAGLITGMLLKFQFFVFASNFILLGIITIFFIKKGDLKYILRQWMHFILPVIVVLLLLLISGSTKGDLLKTFFENFSFGPWDRTRDNGWLLLFWLTNFTFHFVFALVAFFLVLFGKIKGNGYLPFLLLWILVLFEIPHLMRFTIFESDMFKFFYLMIVPTSIICGLFLSRLLRYKIIGAIVVGLIISIMSLNSLITLYSSYLNKSLAYTNSEYQVGLWIRENTPQKSVMMTHPTVHSPVSDIGGRIRVLSYIVWPYTHGFNTGTDNVFSRQDDIKSMFLNPTDYQKTTQILGKYQTDYIYYGEEERRQYPDADLAFEQNQNLQLVYNKNGIKLFKVL